MNKEEFKQELLDAKESYDEYYNMLGNELYDLTEKKSYYYNLLEEFDKEYGPISELDGQDIYKDWLNIKKEKEETSEVENWKNKYTYLLADFDNYKKRIIKQNLENDKYKNKEILSKLLVILKEIDIFKENNKEVSPTIDKINNIIQNIFKDNQVKFIYNDERPVFFNEKYDNAVWSVPTDDKSLDNSINKVLNKGYLYKDIVLQYEDVIVNKYQF